MTFFQYWVPYNLQLLWKKINSNFVVLKGSIKLVIERIVLAQISLNVDFHIFVENSHRMLTAPFRAFDCQMKVGDSVTSKKLPNV